MQERGRHRSTLRWLMLGLGLAPGAPLGLYLLLELLGPDDAAAVRELALIYSGVATAIVFAGFGAWAGHLIDRLRNAAMHDGLTGLYNRRFFREALPPLQASALRREQPLCLLMLDLDHFKQVNDRHGHLVGDQTLRAVADTLRAHSRRSDIVARYGGEEFAVLCPDADLEIGKQVAERLRQEIAKLGPVQLGHPGPQTISIGLAAQSDHELPCEQLIEHADIALYRAKRGGRNRTEVWTAE